ncbi:MAG TPA: M23 family metallopeptidase [Pseudolabrys sp.]|jgi:murein DD-endopeptidase MepM/ murein hydrolase activator NlpD|nr:M23 family metallopeptidase [Pseudolabrys sp.]
MSSYSYSHAGDVHHPHTVHAQSAAHVSRHMQRGQNGYTLVHAGRQVRIGPVAFWIVVGTLIVMAIWSVATGSYFAFKENVLTRLIGHQAEMQFAYEDRIAELRAQIDRVTSRQLLDQEQFEQKLDDLLQRQAVIEQRSAALGGDLSAIKRSPKARPRGTMKPAPINDNDEQPPHRQRGAYLQPGSLTAKLGRVAQSLDKVEEKQDAALEGMQAAIDNKIKRVQSVLADLHVDLGKHGDDVTGSIGGPFVPVKAPSSKTSEFERDLYKVNLTRAHFEQTLQQLRGIPLRKPVEGDIDMSSPFGMRMDPFMRGPAIHTGVDLRGDMGEPAHVTASGKVTIAGWSGGYGNMVEVDHLNGLSTRYGHLSKILVKVGQHVTLGQVVGLIGSTGRSTGPHLHYETRVNDTAVDPQKFLRAGQKLGGL